MIVLDTNVVSELMRATPSPVVLTWVSGFPSDELYTTAVTVAEIRCGIARLPEGRHREALRQAANEVFGAFAGQVLPFDLAAANTYADVVAHRDGLGNPIDGFDAQIAAVCRVHVAILATRNTKDFTETGIAVVDPWQLATP
jgi:toxin FitB